jgi:acetyl-CoA carboxylase biotin carboxyl carrier protein
MIPKIITNKKSIQMNIKDIEELIKFVAKSGVSEVDVESKDFKISIKVPVKGGVSSVSAPVAAAPLTPSPVQMAVPVAAAPPVASAEEPKPVAEVSNLITIKSPMIGTFYRTPSPDKPNFVNIGDEIKPGKIIGIIEAMKLFNEIESEVSGKIVKILVDNASPIEYDQPLFLVSPV